MTVIDTNDPDLASAIDHWAAIQSAQSEATAMLLTSLRKHLGLPVDDGLVSFEQVSATKCVRLAGEWWWVRGRAVEPDLEGNPHRFLIVGDNDHEDWRYEATESERFLVSEPF